jgi:methionyl aminopeptidase
MIFGKTDCEIEFMTALNKAKPGERLSNISHAIQKYVEANIISIVREYVGRGKRQELHEDTDLVKLQTPNKVPHLSLVYW